MPRSSRNETPPPVMTWGKAAIPFILAVISDLVRFFFAWFWVFGPAVAAAACTLGLSDILMSWTLGILGTKTAALVCGTGAALGGAAAMAVTMPFGIVMAMFVGFAGWMAVGFTVVVTNARVFKEDAFAATRLGLGLVGSEIPIIDSIPFLTLTVWRLYHHQIQRDQAALRAYQKRHAARIAAQQRAQAAAYQTAQLQEQQAANEAEYEQEAANDAAYGEEDYTQEKRAA